MRTISLKHWIFWKTSFNESKTTKMTTATSSMTSATTTTTTTMTATIMMKLFVVEELLLPPRVTSWMRGDQTRQDHPHPHPPHRVLHPVAAWDPTSTKHLNRLRRNQLELITRTSQFIGNSFSIEKKFHIFPGRCAHIVKSQSWRNSKRRKSVRDDCQKSPANYFSNEFVSRM